MTMRSRECPSLRRWLQNELDVVETYKLALARLHTEQQLAGAREVMREHAEHAAELRDLLRALGEGDLGSAGQPHPCTRERLAMIQLDGDAAFDALLESERQRLAAYEAVLLQPMAPLVAQLVERSVIAERHRVELLRACLCDRLAA
jgi:hypothetical protein